MTAEQVKVGRGALSYTYEVGPKTMRLLGVQQTANLAGMKSVHFWVKCSVPTAVMFGLHETTGANYQISLYCPKQTWQEVSLNLDELVLEENSKDDNGKLDLDQIQGLGFADLGNFLVELAPNLKGKRTLWLDDIAFSAKAVTVTSGAMKTADGETVHLVDNFESPVIRWAPLSIKIDPAGVNIFDAPVMLDRDAPPAGDKQSLKYVYQRQVMQVPALLRNVQGLNLEKAKALNLWLKTAHDGSFVVNLEEKDKSRYQQLIELKTDDGWKKLSYTLDSFTLADDSADENKKLDADQIKEISIADVSTLLGGDPDTENSLWVDEVQFLLADK